MAVIFCFIMFLRHIAIIFYNSYSDIISEVLWHKCQKVHLLTFGKSGRMPFDGMWMDIYVIVAEKIYVWGEIGYVRDLIG